MHELCVCVWVEGWDVWLECYGVGVVGLWQVWTLVGRLGGRTCRMWHHYHPNERLSRASCLLQRWSFLPTGLTGGRVWPNLLHHQHLNWTAAQLCRTPVICVSLIYFIFFCMIWLLSAVCWCRGCFSVFQNDDTIFWPYKLNWILVLLNKHFNPRKLIILFYQLTHTHPLSWSC